MSFHGFTCQIIAGCVQKEPASISSHCHALTIIPLHKHTFLFKNTPCLINQKPVKPVLQASSELKVCRILACHGPPTCRRTTVWSDWAHSSAGAVAERLVPIGWRVCSQTAGHVACPSLMEAFAQRWALGWDHWAKHVSRWCTGQQLVAIMGNALLEFWIANTGLGFEQRCQEQGKAGYKGVALFWSLALLRKPAQTCHVVSQLAQRKCPVTRYFQHAFYWAFWQCWGCQLLD